MVSMGIPVLYFLNRRMPHLHNDAKRYTKRFSSASLACREKNESVWKGMSYRTKYYFWEHTSKKINLTLWKIIYYFSYWCLCRLNFMQISITAKMFYTYFALQQTCHNICFDCYLYVGIIAIKMFSNVFQIKLDRKQSVFDGDKFGCSAPHVAAMYMTRVYFLQNLLAGWDRRKYGLRVLVNFLLCSWINFIQHAGEYTVYDKKKRFRAKYQEWI